MICFTLTNTEVNRNKKKYIWTQWEMGMLQEERLGRKKGNVSNSALITVFVTRR